MSAGAAGFSVEAKFCGDPGEAVVLGRLVEEVVGRLVQTLYAVFATNSVPHRTELLNHFFSTHAAVPRLFEGVRMAAVGGAGAVGKLDVLAADVLARVIAEGSADVCGDPCRCVYVDRTKANRQRYCCELCNDRMASAAYRRRNR